MRPHRLALLAALSCALAVGPAAAPAGAQDPPGVRSVRPSVTDARLTGSDSPHHVVTPRAAAVGRLLVFLPGSGAAPLAYDEQLLAAARAGYHAVGVTYDNAVTAGARCGNRLGCYGPLHQRVFDGTGSSAEAGTRPLDGVEHRLAALLAHLARTHPREGWGAYVSGGLPVWSRVVVAGHSQGASQAAWAGKVRVVAGVVMLSGPADGDTGGRPATWLSSGHRTPSARYVGLTHTGDPWFARDLAAWRALGVHGAASPASVDGGLVTSRHAMVTSGPLRGLGLLRAHNQPAVDSATPRCGALPALAPVWRAMLALSQGQRVTVRPAC